MAKARIKILYASRALESPPREGGFVVLSDIAKRLNVPDLGYDPYMFSVKNISISGLGTEKVFTQTGWNARVKIEFFYGLFRKAHLYDIVHTAHIPTKQNSRLIKLAIKKARKSNTLFVQTITGLPKIDISQKDLKKLLWGDHIVCQSEKTYKKVKNALDQLQSCSLIVPWRPNSSISYSEERRVDTRNKLFSGFKKVVVFPGEFDRLGVDATFSECIKTFLKSSPDSLVVFACRFDKKKTGQVIAQQFPNQVRSLGSTEDIIPILEASDLIIYPVRTMNSKFQPPLVLLEALQLRSRVLISKVVDLDSNLSPLIAYENTGSWVAFGKKMAELIRSDSPSSHEPSNYSFNKMFDQYLDVYKNLGKKVS